MKNIDAFLLQDPFYIKQMPKKRSMKLTILTQCVQHLYVPGSFSEKEITDRLRNICEDPVEMRRNLVDFGLLNRTRDGSSYWFSKQTSTKISIHIIL